MSGAVIMRAENLRAGYESGRDILRGIGFSLREGERLCVLGPNGCGKTTLLRVLAGTLPYRGSLEIAVTDPRSPRHGLSVERSSLAARESARETGYLAQLSSSYFPFTVRDTVLLGRYSRQPAASLAGPSRADRAAAESAMTDCGIEALADSPLSTLSGGQLQRVFLARVLAQDPATLLLDEPTNHLDLNFQLELLRLIDAWIGRGRRAAVGVFHDLSLAFSFADSVLLLDKGEAVAYGTAREVLKGDAINRVYGMDVAGAMRDLLQKW